MKLRPRPYQTEAVQSIYTYFSESTGNPLILMPTGSGKAVVIAMFLESIYQYYPNQRVMVLTHVKELIAQNYEKLVSLWPHAPAGIYSAGLNRRDYGHRITFAGIASVSGKTNLFGHVDLVIIDEAHLVSPNDKTMYQQFLDDLHAINPMLKVIGLTATGWRLGQGHITDDGIFTDVCYDLTTLHAFNMLIAEGYLCPLVPKQPGTLLDTSNVHMRGGEFVASELQHAVDVDAITEAAVKEMMELGADRQHWLVFASGVQHAEHVAQMLNHMGVPSVVIHSQMKSKDRDKGIADWKVGRYRCAVNNNVLTTGVDFPGIDLIGVLRPTASTSLWVQMLGRGTRPVYAAGFNLDTTEGRLQAIQEGPKQNCLVLDFASNTRRLGPINDPVIPRKKGKGGGEAPVKLCNSCATWNHASVSHCVVCGAEFAFTVKLKQEASSEALIKEDMPIVELFKIDHITYMRHEKVGAAPMVKVSYYCGLRMFNEYVCPEHEGYAKRKARLWWEERASKGIPIPASTNTVLELAGQLRAPQHLRVWTNKRYPEILGCSFDGTAFGTQPADPNIKVTTDSFVPKAISNTQVVESFDDNIPF